MSDVRALLKAKRQEARVNHPLASYTTSGQLRCIACGTLVKQSSSWEGHVGSKIHRLNAAKLREQQSLAAEETRLQGKRKMEEEDFTAEVTVETKKMKLSGINNEETTSSSRQSDVAAPPAKVSNGFPADFFSDPSNAPPPPDADADEDEEGPTVEAVETQPPRQVPAGSIDQEWAAFEQQVLNQPDKRDIYEQATVFAEPELAPQTPVGFPPLQTDDADEAQSAPEFSEDELRRKRELEDRELIMDRLLDEERAQEEADAKVTLLKNRLDALRRQRETKKAEQTSKKAKPWL